MNFGFAVMWAGGLIMVTSLILSPYDLTTPQNLGVGAACALAGMTIERIRGKP